MKLMGHWTLEPGERGEAFRRFLASGARPPEGVTIVGRWHSVGGKEGFVLFETDDMAALAAHVSEWGDVIDLRILPVIEDAEAGYAITTGMAARAR